MRLVTYAESGNTYTGIEVDGRVVEARMAARGAGLPALDVSGLDVIGVLTAEAVDRRRLGQAAADLAGVPLGGLTLRPPVARPQKILCIGLNYQSHLEEARRHNLPVPDQPIVFSKFRTSLLGPGEPVVLPRDNPDRVDYEGELAVVIGRGGKHITESDALQHVGGYMPLNDVSARDLQLASPQWTMGKAFDASAPCGPVLVTADEVPDPRALHLRTIHNGEIVQEASTGELIFPVEYLIAHISALITLEPGDIIATGTPAGVGHAREPQRYLHHGDTIEVDIEGLGRLSNPVMSESISVASATLGATA